METNITTQPKPQNKRRRKAEPRINPPSAPNDILVKAKANEGQFEMSMIDKSQVVQIVKKEIIVSFD